MADHYRAAADMFPSHDHERPETFTGPIVQSFNRSIVQLWCPSRICAKPLGFINANGGNFDAPAFVDL